MYDMYVFVISMNCGFYSLKIKMRVLADYAGEMFACGKTRRESVRERTKTEMARLRKDRETKIVQSAVSMQPGNQVIRKQSQMMGKSETSMETR
jgi:hypothetical protein